MKTIEISDENYEFLQSLAKELSDQDNRHTQNVGFAVYECAKNGNVKGINDRPGVFLTAKACEEHIAGNSYHYKNPVCYGIDFWRNYEMIELIGCIFDITKVKKPDHYS